MFSFRLLLVCGWLVLLLPTRVVSAPKEECTLWDQIFEYFAEQPIPVDGSTINLRICGPAQYNLNAQSMLELLEQALPALSRHAGFHLQGSSERTVILVPTADLHQFNADGMLSAKGIIYLHPGSPRHTVVHEAAHYWANKDNFDELWMIEGYADYLTKLVMEDLNELYQPRIPQPNCATVSLQDWQYEPPETAQCGYAVGAEVFRDLAQAVGEQQFRDTMRLLGDRSRPMTNWDLLMTLERRSGLDLTDIMKHRVFSPFEHQALEQRRTLWNQLRDAAKLVESLPPIKIPPVIAELIDSGEFVAAEQLLTDTLPLLKAATTVKDRCAQVALPCVRPWEALPAEPHTWRQTTQWLVKAGGLLEQYAQLHADAQRFGLAPPPALAQALAELQLGTEQRIAAAREALSRLQALEQRCQELKAECRKHWLSHWDGENLEAVASVISALNGLLTDATTVGKQCGELQATCRQVWQTALQQADLVSGQQALAGLKAMLDRAANLERECKALDWTCTAWRQTFKASGVQPAKTLIDQTTAQVVGIKPQITEIERRCGAGLQQQCHRIWHSALTGGGFDAARQELNRLDKLLTAAAGLENTCRAQAWNCAAGWRAAFAADGIDRANAFIAEAGKSLNQLQVIAGDVAQHAAERDLIGSMTRSGTPQADLEQAQQLFAKGDVAGALTLAQQAEASQQTAARRRTLAIQIAWGVGGGFLFALLLALIIRRRRSARPRPAAQPAAADDLLAALLAQQPQPPRAPKRTQ